MAYQEGEGEGNKTLKKLSRGLPEAMEPWRGANCSAPCIKGLSVGIRKIGNGLHDIDHTLYSMNDGLMKSKSQ